MPTSPIPMHPSMRHLMSPTAPIEATEHRGSFYERADKLLRKGTPPVMRGWKATLGSNVALPVALPMPPALSPKLMVPIRKSNEGDYIRSAPATGGGHAGHSGGTAHASGPGSRGGQVVGRTRSGKPIYAASSHHAHASFSKQDHADAYSTKKKLVEEGHKDLHSETWGHHLAAGHDSPVYAGVHKSDGARPQLSAKDKPKPASLGTTEGAALGAASTAGKVVNAFGFGKAAGPVLDALRLAKAGR